MAEKTEEERELFVQSKELAKKILSNEIETEEAVEKIRNIYVQLGFPAELEMWNLLYDGHSSDWYERSRWLPFIQTYNHESWLQIVRLEATDLANRDYS